MIKNEKLYSESGIQVSLFPLYSFIITQRDDETYSHKPSEYLATDYQAYDYTTHKVLNFQEYYAPCDVVCVGMDKTNASILWRSREKVVLPNRKVDYLIILFYHDNDVPAGKFTVGETRNQGEVIGHTGTYGNNGSKVANHVHMETGFGENWNKVYASPSWGHINLAYALHNYDACYGNNTICNGIPSYPDKYPFINYTGGIDPPTPPSPEINYKKGKFPWYLYTNKRRYLH